MAKHQIIQTLKYHRSTIVRVHLDSKKYNVCDEYTREITLIKYSNVLTGVLLVSFRLTKYRMIIVPTPMIDITDKITVMILHQRTTRQQRVTLPQV
jgi:hypothetical protein